MSTVRAFLRDCDGLGSSEALPPGLVTGVVQALEGLGPVLVEERGSAHEAIQFALPSNVKAR